MPLNKMETCPHCDRAGEVYEEVQEFEWGKEYLFFCKKCRGSWVDILEYDGEE